MRPIARRVPLVVLALAAACLGPGCGGRPRAEKVLLRLNWYPEMEHGGFYAALVESFYEEEGLEVEILRGGDQTPVAREVAAGSVTFGLTDADSVLLARNDGADVVAVMAPFQQSPISIMVHESSGIRSLNDLRDLTLAIEPGVSYARYLRKKVPLTNVKIVPYSGGVAQFLADPRFAQQGYLFSEPLLVLKEAATAPANADPRCLPLSEIGYNPYATALIARGSLIREHPELVRKMVRASRRGWERYLEAPERANAFIQQVNPVIGGATLAEGAKLLTPLVRDETAARLGIGHMSPDRWEQLLAQLEEIGAIPPGTMKASDAFDTRFLPRE